MVEAHVARRVQQAAVLCSIAAAFGAPFDVMAVPARQFGDLLYLAKLSTGSCTHLVKREKTKLATIGRNIEFGLALGAHRKSANNNGDGRRSIFGERTCDPCRRQSRLIDAWIRIIKCVHDPLLS